MEIIKVYSYFDSLESGVYSFYANNELILSNCWRYLLL